MSALPTPSIAERERALGENAPARILERGALTLDGEDIPIEAAITEREGRFLQGLIGEVRPSVYLEIGFAFGVSALFAELALSGLGAPYRHIIVDPLQASFERAGARLLEETGYAANLELHERGSEIILPRLVDEGRVVDLAFIDGWHTFDHVMVDFFYINRLLRPGGVVVFDDANWPGVARVIRHARTYPCYRLRATAGAPLPSRLAAAAARRSPSRLNPSIVALEKTAEDRRGWDWDARF